MTNTPLGNGPPLRWQACKHATSRAHHQGSAARTSSRFFCSFAASPVRSVRRILWALAFSIPVSPCTPLHHWTCVRG